MPPSGDQRRMPVGKRSTGETRLFGDRRACSSPRALPGRADRSSSMTVTQSKARLSKPADSPNGFTGTGDTNQLNPMFARAGEATDFPLNRMPQGESLQETAYQIVHDEAMLDGNARLNLA